MFSGCSLSISLTKSFKISGKPGGMVCFVLYLDAIQRKRVTLLEPGKWEKPLNSRIELHATHFMKFLWVLVTIHCLLIFVSRCHGEDCKCSSSNFTSQTYQPTTTTCSNGGNTTSCTFYFKACTGTCNRRKGFQTSQKFISWVGSQQKRIETFNCTNKTQACPLSGTKQCSVSVSKCPVRSSQNFYVFANCCEAPTLEFLFLFTRCRSCVPVRIVRVIA